MLKPIEKQKKVTPPVFEQPAEAVTCGGCGHVREQDASCPDWQCPGCGKAYHKVEAQPEELMSQQELRRMNQRYLEKKRRGESHLQTLQEEFENPALKGIGAGLLTFLSGVGSACVAANPVIQAIGIIVIVGSAIYGLSHFWS